MLGPPGGPHSDVGVSQPASVGDPWRCSEHRPVRSSLTRVHLYTQAHTHSLHACTCTHTCIPTLVHPQEHIPPIEAPQVQTFRVLNLLLTCNQRAGLVSVSLAEFYSGVNTKLKTRSLRAVLSQGFLVFSPPFFSLPPGLFSSFLFFSSVLAPLPFGFLCPQ